MKEIVLASASPRRCELLRQIGLKFKVVPSQVEEKMNLELDAAQIAEKLALQKANSIAFGLQGNCIVIGADTIVVKEEILGKPENEHQAFQMLTMLQGQWHTVITGLALIDCSDGKVITVHEKTKVKMKSLDEDKIWAYIHTKEPMDKAGAYGIQGLGSLLVEKIEGCYFNVVGLPLAKLSTILEELDVRVL